MDGDVRYVSSILPLDGLVCWVVDRSEGVRGHPSLFMEQVRGVSAHCDRVTAIGGR